MSVLWATGRLPGDAPADLVDAIDVVRLGVTLTWADLQAMPQAVADYLPMVAETLRERREREARR